MNDFIAVVFRIGNEEYGIHLNQVSYIERVSSIKALPKMPSYVRGIIELRGNVIPILDLRRVLLEQDIVESDSTRIIAVNINEKLIGLAVDAATDIVDIPSECIQQPDLIEDVNFPFLIGIAKMKERLLILLDINNLLNNKSVQEQVNKIKEAI
ncbi:chemotaxis protein CheW [Bacillus sp. FJAT-29937]|uniref:chemotaxis protein CheW n=1 Tax=Bacillus sp. FJAT-29937 TaxID=1720553 RepID=UPI000831E211|nr:chemotaxis protein CheW [Bacillus sp. FJAT-29937]